MLVNDRIGFHVSNASNFIVLLRGEEGGDSRGEGGRGGRSTISVACLVCVESSLSLVSHN